MKIHENAYLLWDLLAGDVNLRSSAIDFCCAISAESCEFQRNIEGKVRTMAGVVQGSCKMFPSTMRLPSIWFSSRSAATTICTASKVDPPNIAHLCEKARLTLTPDEIKDFEPQIGRIVDWFAQLQDIDLANVAPAIRVGDIDPSKTLRPDTAKVFSDREAMLAAAPDRDGPFLKVPKIMKENQE